MRRSGALGEQLRCLKTVVEALADMPVIQTVFSPLAPMKSLAGERLLIDLRQHPVEFKTALETIAQSTLAFVREIASTGAAGIFYAVQHATSNLLSEAEFAEFGREYDLRILEALERLLVECVAHSRRQHLLRRRGGLSAAGVELARSETGPSLEDGLAKIKGAACGGIARDSVMLCGQPDVVRQQVGDALRAEWAALHRRHRLRDNDPDTGNEYPGGVEARAARLTKGVGGDRVSRSYGSA